MYLLGKASNKMWEPSNGGMGRRLKKNKNMLKKMPYQNIFKTKELLPMFAFKADVKSKRKIMARTRLEKGPANETKASSLRGFLKFLLSTGTGLAQPIKANPEKKVTNGTITVPIRSACFIGFIVILPAFFAVESPSFDAVIACANSCKVIEIKNIGKKSTNEISFSLI